MLASTISVFLSSSWAACEAGVPRGEADIRTDCLAATGGAQWNYSG